VLWLVTPVHGRFALTRLIFEQRARMLNELQARGIEARQVVVGDDANLATAREFGFHTLERPNVLGLRVNEGFEWAVREGGAAHVAYCGSDDWHAADYFADLPAPGFAKTSYWQAFVPPTGDRLVVMRSQCPAGGAPWVISRELIEPAGYRPADDTAPTAVDGSIADGIWAPIDALHRRSGNHERRLAKKRVFQPDDSDLLRMVDFKAGGEQITPFERVVGLKRKREIDSRTPWELLATRYPADLVGRMEKFYATKEAR
jgi:hypothetical protein